MRVLEVGSGLGDLLAAVRPSYGVGIDLSPAMLSLARVRHPQLHFQAADAQSIDLKETFDYIICADLVNDLWDVEQVLDHVHRHCDPSTRVILNAYSRVWELPRRIAEKIGLAKALLPQNWLMASDIQNLLYLSDFEVIRFSPEILCPFPVPLLGKWLNRFLVRLWPFSLLALTNLLVARTRPEAPRTPEPMVTVVVAARNEEGNIPQIFDRVPASGKSRLLSIS